MHRDTFGKLALLAFGLILASFVLMGFSRIVVPFRVARLLAAPTITVGALLVAYLFVESVLVSVGVRELEE